MFYEVYIKLLKKREKINKIRKIEQLIFKARVAQSGSEHLTRNEGVRGSNPLVGFQKKEVLCKLMLMDFQD